MSSTNRTNRAIHPAILSALVAIATYAVAIPGTYVYDDVGIFQLDKRLHDPHQWRRYWTESYNQGIDNLYRPLVSMTYAIQWWMHGDRPWIFHLVNILMHAAVAAGVAELARRLIGMRAAFFAGVIFAAHPVHVEAAVNIVGRAELMCAIGVVGALVVYLHRPLSPRRAIAITAFFLLALLSKEQGMLVPLLIFILGLRKYFGQNPVESRQHRHGLQTLTLCMCWILAGYIVWRESILKFWWDRTGVDWTINPIIASEAHPYGGVRGADILKMPLAIFGRYISLLVFPIHLSPDYGGKVIGWHISSVDPYLYIGIIALVAWLIAMIWSLRNRSIVGVFTLVGFALTYGMVGNIVAYIGTNFGERLIYLPSVFFVVLIAAIASKLPRNVFISLTIFIATLCAIRTTSYAPLWNDRLTFYNYSLARQPDSIRLHMLLASEYESRGDMAAAERTVAAGRTLLPQYWDIWVQSAEVAMRQNKFDEARDDLNHAMRLFPNVRIEGWLNELERRRIASTQPTTNPNNSLLFNPAAPH